MDIEPSPVGTFDSRAWTDWLHGQLLRRQWKAADLARALKVPPGTVSRWVTGERQPSPESCDRIADVLNVDVDLVLTLAGHRPASEPLKPDDPAAELCAKVRRVKWDDERLDHIRYVLDLWIKYDRKGQQKGEG